jgi:single-strand DNA-binding protein
MAGEIPITVIGSITEPTLRFSQSGKAVVSFSLAHNNRVKDGENWVDGEPTWFRVSAFGPIAENIVESVEKGTRVIVQGGMKTTKWTTQEGEERTSLEIIADAVGPDLRWATAKAVRAPGGGRGGDAAAQSSVQRSRAAAPADDPWATEPPF